VWISACVERVWNVFPHAQMTVAVAYTGWMSAFMRDPWKSAAVVVAARFGLSLET
jgi:hypothetical protein